MIVELPIQKLPKGNLGTFYDWTLASNPPTGTLGGNYSGILLRRNLLISKTNPKRNGVYIDGGYFHSMREISEYNNGQDLSIYRPFVSGPCRAYQGKSYVLRTSAKYLTPAGTDEELRALFFTRDMAQGANFWNRLRPARPDFSFASSLYELKDVPSMLKDGVLELIHKMSKTDLWKRRLAKGYERRRSQSVLSRTAEFHLALQFGWLPLLSDIQKFVIAQRQKQTSLAKLIRQEGKPARRDTRRNKADPKNPRYDTNIDGTEQDTKERQVFNTPYGARVEPTFVTQVYNGGYAWEEQQYTVATKRWSVGKFRYLLPPGPRDVVWTRNMMRRIMGARVTPTSVYAVMPWSWLIDYFTGLGDFIQAVSPGVEDRLICDYAYIMASRDYTAKVTATNFVIQNTQGTKTGPQTASYSSKLIVRTRVHATPFGFGVKMQDLSLSQIGILGALGLSRLP